LLEGTQRLVLTAVVAGAGIGLAFHVPAGATTPKVTIASSTFTPNPVHIPVDATVKWTNEDGFDHTVTSDDLTSFDSGPLAKNASFRHTFGQAGTFTYHCKIHTAMQATIVVGDTTTSTTVPPTTTTTEPPATTPTADTSTTAPVVEEPAAVPPPEPVPTTAMTVPVAAKPPLATTTTSAGPAALIIPGSPAVTDPPAPPAPEAPQAAMPPSGVASGQARGRAEHSNGALPVAIGLGLGLALGGGAWWARRARSR